MRERNPGAAKVKFSEFERCVFLECGTSPTTVFNNLVPLQKLGWVKRRKKIIHLTDRDITDF